MIRPEDRFDVDFTIFVSWQDRAGKLHQVSARCVDLPASGARAELREPLPARALFRIQSGEFGYMGHATVRYCNRDRMKYNVGLRFSTAFSLSYPERRKILSDVIVPAAT